MEPEAKRRKTEDGVAAADTHAAADAADARHSIATAAAAVAVSNGDGEPMAGTLPSQPADGSATTTVATDDTAGADGEGKEKEEKVRRRKVALMLCYCGAHYMGMQRNAPFTTIESEVFKAMVKAGCIDQEDAEDSGRMRFQRASRTDKGVSACHQVISFKMIDNLIGSINEHLPKDIRTFAVLRTTSGFSSYTQSTGRAYEYVMPSFALAPSLSKSVSTYRVDAERIELANRLFAKYVGTHNFHNFTSGRQAGDQSSRRVMRAFSVKGEPYVDENTEFITLRVVGQSFMLHQIRKMIGLVLAIMKGYCLEDAIEVSRREARMDIPRAPGLGLLLDQVQFEGYDRRFGKDGIHKPLVWTDYATEVEAFKREHIISTIIDEEKKTLGMMKWLHTLPLHEYTRFTGHKVGPRNAADGTDAAPALETTTADSAEAAAAATTAATGDESPSSTPAPADTASPADTAVPVSSAATEAVSVQQGESPMDSTVAAPSC